MRIRLGTAPIALPEPVADLTRQLLPGKRGHAGHPSPWLFPGGQPGRPISATHLGQRLKDLGIQPGQARSTALFQLATELPAALLPACSAPLSTATDRISRNRQAFRQFQYPTVPLRVLPAAQRRCADTTAALVLAADWHTRKRIKAKAAKNRPAPRGEKQMPPPDRRPRPSRNRRSRPHRRAHRHGL